MVFVLNAVEQSMADLFPPNDERCGKGEVSEQQDWYQIK